MKRINFIDPLFSKIHHCIYANFPSKYAPKFQMYQLKIRLYSQQTLQFDVQVKNVKIFQIISN